MPGNEKKPIERYRATSIAITCASLIDITLPI